LKTHKILIILGISVLSCLMLFSSCVQTGYKTFAQTKGVDHYSFERPAAYKQTVNLAVSSPLADNGVRFVGKLSDGSEIDLVVNIGAHHADTPDAQAATEKEISVAGRELINRSPGTISGLSCEIITEYTESLPQNNITSKYQMITYFDYNGRLWDIVVYSERGDSEQVNALFNHVIETFKLLS
jgi:hypothetical protein